MAEAKLEVVRLNVEAHDDVLVGERQRDVVCGLRGMGMKGQCMPGRHDAGRKYGILESDYGWRGREGAGGARRTGARTYAWPGELERRAGHEEGAEYGCKPGLDGGQ